MPLDRSAFGVDLHLDLAQAGGRRAALEQALREAIRGGRLAPQTRLPSTRTLAAQLGLARNTVSAAYDQLVAEGYLGARTGSGTVVLDLAAPVRTPPAARPSTEPRFDLRPGSPDVSAFPTAAWLRAGRRALNRAPAAAFGYTDPRGRIELRTALAEYLGRARGVSAEPDRIVVTSGYVQALGLLVRAVGGSVAMEDPGLPFHREVVAHTGAAVLPLPVDERGARTDLLGHGGLAAARVAVLTPAHQYPTGATLHPDRRRAAVAWARSGGGVVLEDDYDGEFRYDRQPVGALQGTAPEEVAYVGTAAKTLAPGVRLAWMVLPERLVEPVVREKRLADLHTETLGQLTLAELITGHDYDRQVRAARLRYRRRRDRLVDRLGGEHRLTGIAAGLQVLLPLTGVGPAEQELLDRAEGLGLALDGLGHHFHVPGPDRPQGLIIGYATPGPASYAGALELLGRVLGGD